MISGFYLWSYPYRLSLFALKKPNRCHFTFFLCLIVLLNEFSYGRWSSTMVHNFQERVVSDDRRFSFWRQELLLLMARGTRSDVRRYSFCMRHLDASKPGLEIKPQELRLSPQECYPEITRLPWVTLWRL